MDEVKQAELSRFVDEILEAGEQAVEEFNCDDYTLEELEFIMSEMHRKNTQDLDKLMQDLENSEQL